MSRTAFALRAEYESSFGEATLAVGPESKVFSVKEALEDGNGQIVTDNPLLISALEGVDGGNGPLFKRVSAGDGPLARLPWEPRKSDENRTQNESGDPSGEGEETNDDEEAVNNADSEYDNFSREDLKQLARERDLDVRGDATKEQLVAALEADDDDQEG